MPYARKYYAPLELQYLTYKIQLYGNLLLKKSHHFFNNPSKLQRSGISLRCNHPIFAVLSGSTKPPIFALKKSHV